MIFRRNMRQTYLIKAMADRAFDFLLPDDRGKGYDRRRVLQPQSLPPCFFHHIDHRRYFSPKKQKNTAAQFVQP